MGKHLPKKGRVFEENEYHCLVFNGMTLTRVCLYHTISKRRLLKMLWDKEEMVVTGIFFFSINVFHSCNSMDFKMLSCSKKAHVCKLPVNLEHCCILTFYNIICRVLNKLIKISMLVNYFLFIRNSLQPPILDRTRRIFG